MIDSVRPRRRRVVKKPERAVDFLFIGFAVFTHESERSFLLDAWADEIGSSSAALMCEVANVT